MKNLRLPLFSLVFLLWSSVANSQTLGWSCLIEANGDTVRARPASLIEQLVKGKDGALYIIGGLKTGTNQFTVGKWNDTALIELNGPQPANSVINARAICTDTSGNIYVAGTNAATGIMRVMRWTGTQWEELGSGVSGLDAAGATKLCTDIYGNVYVAGYTSVPVFNSYVFRWDGQQWTLITDVNLLNGVPNALVSDKLGNVYIAGTNKDANDKYYVAKWNGVTWSQVGTGPAALNADDDIMALYVDDANNVYAAGKFPHMLQKYVAKWDGTSWTEVGTGSNRLLADDWIWCLYGEPGKIYASGRFGNANGKTYVAEWNGTTWAELGSAQYPLNFTYPGGLNPTIFDICRDGKGSLYVCGDFDEMNKNGMKGIARYGIIPSLSVATVGSKNRLQVYPNPTSGTLNLQFDKPVLNVDYMIYDYKGMVVQRGALKAQETPIAVSELANGIYFLKLAGEQETVVKFEKR